MLRLENITKTYVTGDVTQKALDNISISFRKSEFVSVLGQSGSGKTTLLNIIGGLDQYTTGDLVINGRSTKKYTDRDWDSYRNHSIGFVFQSYNLIPHQSVLRNVELAMTLSGVSKSERRQRALKALKDVGLEDQVHKRPNQMSGGQMQRVSIARALVNDPDILLADEPTGALDSETSIQVMELLKQIAKDRLVIMVTHNPEIAEKYSTRIVRLFDGHITSDSNPYEYTEQAPDLTKEERRLQKRENRKRSMSMTTALSLSLNNLMTKKGRTFLTAFAGSIGIIGIALILSLSTGINDYIDRVQEETLSSYPITIEAEQVDMSSLMLSFMDVSGSGTERDENRVYSRSVMYDILNSVVNAETETNNLKSFKQYIEDGSEIQELATIQYSYNLPFDVYHEDDDGVIVKSDITELMEEAISSLYGGNYSAYFDSMSSFMTVSLWTELMQGEDGELVSESVKSQYDLIYGKWPENYDEVVLFVNDNNEISDMMLYALGLLPQDEMTDMLTDMQDAMNEGKETPEIESRSWSFEELADMTFKLILPAERYRYDSAADTYVDFGETDTGLRILYENEGTELKIVGIVRPATDSTSATSSTAMGYTTALTEYAIERGNSTDVMKAQLDNPDTDVLVNLPFPKDDDEEPTADEKAAAITEYIGGLETSERAEIYVSLSSRLGDDEVNEQIETQMADMTRESVEALITEQYAEEMGVDMDTVVSYIQSMSDNELFDVVRQAMRENLVQQYAEGVRLEFAQYPDDSIAAMFDAELEGGTLTEEQYDWLYENYMPPTRSDSTYDDNLDLLGYIDIESPNEINIYAETFSDKDRIADLIAEYNDSVANEDDEITYTDYIALLMSSITDIINAISYLLIGFVAISLVVSSIMIGVITYISVLERTKEIGILRAMGASKKDVSRVFNAETLIVGFAAGVIGIGVTVLLIIPANIIIHKLTDISTLSAVLPPVAAVILIVISSLLTIVAGLFPSGIAARKNPVEALRTE